MTSRAPDSTAHPAHALFAAAALHSVASGTAVPLAEALAMSRPRIPEAEALRVSTAAVMSQGLAPLAARLPDVDRLPPALLEFLHREREEARAAAAARVLDLTNTVAALRMNGIEAVLFGEMAAALVAYREAAMRPAGDCRLLLIRGHDARRARQAIPPLSAVSVHTRLAYRFLGATVDLTGLALDEPVVHVVEGVRVLVASPSALAAQLVCAAAAQFEDNGFPGISAIDLRLLALAGAPLALDADVTSSGGAASLIHAVDAVERFCPGTFDPSFVSRLAGPLPSVRRDLGRRVPPLLFTRTPGTPALPVTLGEKCLSLVRWLRRPGLIA
jgi:hypothetical protein